MTGKKKVISVIAGILIPLLIFVPAVVFLYSRDYLPSFPELKNLFAGAYGDSKNRSSSAEFTAESPDYTVKEYFPEISAADILYQLEESQNYTRVYSVVYFSASDSYTEKWTLTRSGNRFRAESNSSLIICDGNRLYIEKAGFSVIDEYYEDAMYAELGITSLDSIRNSPDLVSVTEENGHLSCTVRNTDNQIVNSCEIDTLSGIVTSESTKSDGVTVRIIVTESVTAGNYPDSMFEISGGS